LNQKEINEIFKKLDIHSFDDLPQNFQNEKTENKYELSFDNRTFLLKER